MIPKGKSDPVIEEGQTNSDLQNITQKTKIEQHVPHLKPEVNSGAPEG
jgi:hypothetical protein